MPYKLRKSPGRDLYWVVSKKTGKKFSKSPLKKSVAEAQRRAIYASENSRSRLQGGKCHELNDPLTLDPLDSIPQKYRIQIEVGINSVTGEVIEHCFNIQSLAKYFASSGQLKNPYTNLEWTFEQNEQIYNFLNDDRLVFPEKVPALVIMGEVMGDRDFIRDKIGKLGAQYWRNYGDWIQKGFWYWTSTDYLLQVFQQFDFVTANISPQILNVIVGSLHNISHINALMDAKFLSIDDPSRDYLKDGFLPFKVPSVEGTAVDQILRTPLGAANTDIFRTTVLKIHTLLNVTIPSGPGLTMMGYYFPIDLRYLDEFKNKVFKNSERSVALTYAFLRCLFDGLLTLDQIKLITRVFVLYRQELARIGEVY
jgi:hypothetical protein